MHKPLFAGRDISILAIGDRVSYPHFHDVGSRADDEDLRLAGLHLLAGCGSVDEKKGSGRSSRYHQLGRRRYMRFAVKPAATRETQQRNNDDDSHERKGITVTRQAQQSGRMMRKL